MSAAPDLDAWYRSHGEAVYRRGLRLLGDDAAAWDLVQETFLRARKYLGSFRGGSPLSWLLTIADRCAYTTLKKRGAQKNTVALDDVGALLADEQGDKTALVQRQALVARLLARTDERTALIVVRRYFDELDLTSIANELNLNEKTVRRSLTTFLDEARTYLGGAHA